MTESASVSPGGAIDRQRLDADIVCVGFGPATAGFLTALSRRLLKPDGTPAVESRVMPGMPLQVMCYERADDVGFGVSGVVTRARALRESFPELDPAQVPMGAAVRAEKVVYLLDPVGASRRPALVRAADAVIRRLRRVLPVVNDGFELPWTPAFLHKKGGWVLSMGQFMQWVAGQLQSTGTVQIWPGTPVAQALIEGGHAITALNRVVGVRLVDQGVDRSGAAVEGHLPGMDIHAALTVVGDGPVGAVAAQLDRYFVISGEIPPREWAVGMKFVVDLPSDTTLEPGTVLHTVGFPEPEIFGFLYVHPERVASLGIFVPSWFDSPVRTAYRYLQHWMMHPYLWRHLEGGRVRSWGAKTLGESGRRSEPSLVGNGYARIGEGSGSTNVLTGSGMDEAWATGVQLAEAVLELLAEKRPFTRENLEATYVRRRRASWVESEARVAERSRDGFQRGFVRGVLGMALAGLTGGRFSLGQEPVPPWQRIPSLEEYYRGRIAPETIERLRAECEAKGVSLHGALMDEVGWPAIPHDGRLLLTHQDALLLGGKVQAPAGYADHVVFRYPNLCRVCGTRICIEMCSGQAILPGPDGVPTFDREKCVHCGACRWNCACPQPDAPRFCPEETGVAFGAGTGGLHSAEN